MGDDKYPHAPIYLYSHSSGFDMWKVLQDALAKKWRWNDEAYFARILFDELTKNSHGKETGFGIASYICDNEYPILAIDCHAQKVLVETQEGKKLASYSFEEYLKLTKDPRVGLKL